MYRCPKCNDDETLIADAVVDASIDTQGNLDLLGSNVRLESWSKIFCGACGFMGLASCFEIPDKEAIAEPETS